MAQEKPLERDKNVGSNVSTETIDVKSSNRYYPVEYTSIIQTYDRTNQLKAEVPKSLAGIVNAFNEASIVDYTNKETVALEDEKLRFDLDEKLDELKLKREQGIAVYDRFKQVASEIQEINRKADKEGATNRTQLISEYLKSMENWDEASEYQRSQWSSLLSSHSPNILQEARKADFAYADYLTKFNLVDYRDNQYQSMMKGDIAFRDFYDNIISNLGLNNKELTPEQINREAGEAFNIGILGQAQLTYANVQAGLMTPEAGLEELKELLKTPNEKHTLKDAQGNIVKDAQGEPVTVLGTMTQDTVDKLLSYMQHIANVKGSADGSSNVKSFESLAIDGDEILNLIKNPFNFKDVNDYDSKIGGYIDEVLNNPNIKDSQKIKLLDKVLDPVFQARSKYLISEFMTLTNGKGGKAVIDGINKAYALVQSGYTGLEKLVKEGIQFVDNEGNAKTLTFPPYMQRLLVMGKQDNNTLARYRNFLDQAKKDLSDLSSGISGSVLNKSDQEYHDNTVSISNILGDPAPSSNRQVQEASIVGLIKKQDQKAFSKGFAKSVISSEEFAQYFSAINSQKTNRQRAEMSTMLGRALSQEGHVDDLLKYLGTSGISDSNKTMANMVLAGMLTDGDEESTELVNQFYDKFPDKESLNIFKETNKLLYNEADNTKKINDKYLKKVPSEYRSYLNNISNTLNLAALERDGKADAGFKAFDRVMKLNFHDVKASSGIKTMLFKKGALIQGVARKQNISPDQAAILIERTSSETTKYNTSMFAACGKNKNSYGYIEDFKTGTLRLAFKVNNNWKPLNNSNFAGENMPIGIMNLEGLTENTTNVLGQLNSIKIGCQIYMTDPSVRDYAWKEGHKVIEPYVSTAGNSYTNLVTNKLSYWFKTPQIALTKIQAIAKQLDDPDFIQKAITRKTNTAIQSQLKSPTAAMYFTNKSPAQIKQNVQPSSIQSVKGTGFQELGVKIYKKVKKLKETSYGSLTRK